MTLGKPGSQLAKEAAAKLAATVRAQPDEAQPSSAPTPTQPSPTAPTPAPAVQASPSPAVWTNGSAPTAPPVVPAGLPVAPAPFAANAAASRPPVAQPAVAAPIPSASAGPGSFPGTPTAGIPTGAAAMSAPAATRSAPAAAGSLGSGTSATATQQRPAQPPSSSSNPAGRRVRLTVSRVDPWSVMKISFLVSVAIGIALVVMVAVLWLILDGMGVFNSVNRTVQDVAGSNSTFDLMNYIALPRVLSLAVVIGVIDVILLTALSTLSAFLYNVCSSLVGGVQLTLSDD